MALARHEAMDAVMAVAGAAVQLQGTEVREVNRAVAVGQPVLVTGKAATAQEAKSESLVGEE